MKMKIKRAIWVWCFFACFTGVVWGRYSNVACVVDVLHLIPLIYLTFF